MPDTQRPVALVSGGSRCIGRAFVSRPAHEGFDVAFCYRSDADAADEVVKSATDTGARVVPHRVDVASPEGARAFTDAAESELGPIDAVVASAGAVRDNPLVRMTGEASGDVMATSASPSPWPGHAESTAYAPTSWRPASSRPT